MPRTRSLAWSELKVGLLSIAAVVIAGTTIIMLTGGRGFFWQRYSLKTRFPNVAGLKPGSPVRLAGVEVGSVQETALTGDQVDVTFQVNRAYRERITTSSIATLGSISLLGESAVDITSASTGTPIPEWGYVRPGPPLAALADITNSAGKGIDELTALLQDVRGGKGTVGKLMTDEQLYVELNRFVATANDLTSGIRQGRGSIGKLLNDPATANALEASLKNIEGVTRKLTAGEGSLGKLLNDETFARDLSSATNHIDTLVAKLNSGEGTAGKLLNDPALFNRLNSVTERLDELMTRLNNGEGTAGQLLKDKQLYENMNKTVSEAGALVAELKAFLAEVKKDPKKYFDVKVGIFAW
jgi:phospholipid/cholesterol/gamma-HCH transport system substrate-binding protein